MMKENGQMNDACGNWDDVPGTARLGERVAQRTHAPRTTGRQGPTWKDAKLLTKTGRDRGVAQRRKSLTDQRVALGIGPQSTRTGVRAATPTSVRTGVRGARTWLAVMRRRVPSGKRPWSFEAAREGTVWR
jgi:hypothetical protein